MEALAALSLACNVVQLVDFGLTIARDCRQIYKTGETIKQQDFVSQTKNLSAISGSLKDAIPTLQPLTKADTELYNIANECQDLAMDLQKELEEISKGPSGSLRASFTKTIRSRWRTGRIEKIMTRLLEYRELLETRILVALYEKSNIVVFEQRERFERLQSDLQYFISRLANGFTSLTELTRHEADRTRKHVTSEHDATREHVTNTMRGLEIQTKHPLLESLKFPEINFRQEQIADAYQDTF
ncbi:MAG: hypothetical protein Q9224_006484, partial [Gallowayella concinna]